MHSVSGADGCRAGWVLVSRDLENGALSWRLCPDARSLIHTEPPPEVLAIDIPIGLPAAGARDCDRLARQLLGPAKRGSSVFPAPLRPMLAARIYQEACEIRFGIEQKRMSIQAWGILPKIREVDAVLAVDTTARWRVHEVHPEVCFHFLGAGHPPQHSKKTQAGREERLRLLSPVFGDAPLAALSEKGALAAQDDDILDAFAALWTAERIARGISITLPPHPPKDALGLNMEIVC